VVGLKYPRLYCRTIGATVVICPIRGFILLCFENQTGVDGIADHQRPMYLGTSTIDLGSFSSCIILF
jgi:hypothetical protein